VASDRRPGASKSDGAWRGSRLGIIGVHPGVFGKECANDWKDRRWESLLAKSDKERTVCAPRSGHSREKRGRRVYPPPGNLCEYQTKGVAREAVYMSNKTGELREEE